MAGVIPAGNGTDPWKMLALYVQDQQRQRLQNNRSEDLARSQNFQREMQDRRPGDEYLRTRAVGSANIENAQAAIDAGLEPEFGLGRGRGRSGRSGGIVDTPAAQEFAKGLSDGGITGPLQTAALLGNSQIESAGFNPAAVGDSGTAFGMMQWRLDRQDRLRRFAAAVNRPVTDPYVQGKFAAWELQNTHREAGQQLANAKTLGEAQLAMNNYLRMKNWDKGAGGMHFNERMIASRGWAAKLTGGTKSDFAINKAGGAEVMTDENGKRYTVAFPSPNYLRTFYNTPGYEDLAKRYRPAPEMGINKNGQMAHRYYLDAPDDPVVPAAATPAAPAPAGIKQVASAPEPATTASIVPPPKQMPSQAVAPLEQEEDEDGLEAIIPTATQVI